ncbi:hypothetical protein Y032_0522g2876, partial [Ancylostoma ceylanicum]
LGANATLYTKAKSTAEVCSQCKSKLPKDPCIKHLCQQEYTRGEEL